MNRLLSIWQRMSDIAQSRFYWLALLLVVLAMEALALVYQYAWDYEPCVLCIHVRVWLLGVMVVSLLGLLLAKQRYIAGFLHLLSAGLFIGLLERAYQLLATERGWIFGSCEMDAGLPNWLALDSWFPAIFEIKTSCGYTPELLFGITMAEGLLVFAVVMCLTGLLLFLRTLRDIVG